MAAQPDRAERAIAEAAARYGSGGVPKAERRIQLSSGMSTAPNEDAVGRAWSWALTRAGMMKVRGADDGALGSIEVMRPLSCRSTTFCRVPRSEPAKRAVAEISSAMSAEPFD